LKLTTFLLLLFLQVSATGYSQKKLRVNFASISLDRLIEYMESNSNYRFFYNNDDVDARKLLTVKMNGVTVKELIEKLRSNWTSSLMRSVAERDRYH